MVIAQDVQPENDSADFFYTFVTIYQQRDSPSINPESYIYVCKHRVLRHQFHNDSFPEKSLE